MQLSLMDMSIFSVNSFSRFDGKLLQNEFFVNARTSLQLKRFRKYDALGKRSIRWNVGDTSKKESRKTTE